MGAKVLSPLCCWMLKSAVDGLIIRRIECGVGFVRGVCNAKWNGFWGLSIFEVTFLEVITLNAGE